MLCDRLGWNMFKIKVEITWRMLQTGISQACYVGVPICSDGSVLQCLELRGLMRLIC
jgi:hypothetical protein